MSNKKTQRVLILIMVAAMLLSGIGFSLSFLVQ